MHNQFSGNCFSSAFEKVHPFLITAIYCGSVIVTAYILHTFYPPRYGPGTPALSITVVMMAAMQFAVYALYSAIFYALSYFRGIRQALPLIVSGVVVAHIPSLILQCLILFVPGFAQIEPGTRLIIPLTSPASWLPYAQFHPTLVALLNAFDVLNVVTLALLSLVLQRVANLSFVSSLIANAVIIAGVAIVL